MEQQILFKMMFQNAMRAQQMARVAPIPRAQIFEVPVEQTNPTLTTNRENKTGGGSSLFVCLFTLFGSMYILHIHIPLADSTLWVYLAWPGSVGRLSTAQLL